MTHTVCSCGACRGFLTPADGRGGAAAEPPDLAEARDVVRQLALEVAIHVRPTGADHREHVQGLLQRAKAIGGA